MSFKQDAQQWTGILSLNGDFIISFCEPQIDENR